MNLFYQPGIPEGIHTLDSEESKHCIKVLRKRVGDLIRITDGKGYFYEATITTDDARACAFTIKEKTGAPSRQHFIRIIISPTKNNDRIEWFVEKAVEFGIDRISLADCEHTERTFIKTERLIKVAVSAMKQSLKATLPTIDELRPLKELMQTSTETQRFVAFVDSENPNHLKDVASKHNRYCVLIGPEGDFSKDELTFALELGFTKVSLGSSRLRTETAGVASCHILNLLND